MTWAANMRVSIGGPTCGPPRTTSAIPISPAYAAATSAPFTASSSIGSIWPVNAAPIRRPSKATPASQVTSRGFPYAPRANVRTRCSRTVATSKWADQMWMLRTSQPNVTSFAIRTTLACASFHDGV
jgi:hypothetical protein